MFPFIWNDGTLISQTAISPSAISVCHLKCINKTNHIRSYYDSNARNGFWWKFHEMPPQCSFAECDGNSNNLLEGYYPEVCVINIMCVCINFILQSKLSTHALDSCCILTDIFFLKYPSSLYNAHFSVLKCSSCNRICLYIWTPYNMAYLHPKIVWNRVHCGWIKTICYILIRLQHKVSAHLIRFSGSCFYSSTFNQVIRFLVFPGNKVQP